MKPYALKSDKWLDAIRSGKTQFRFKVSRRDNEDGTAPDWKDPQVDEFFVFLRKTAVGKKYPANEILTFTPRNLPWAEYGEQHHYCGDGLFMAEEFRMQLLEVL